VDGDQIANQRIDIVPTYEVIEMTHKNTVAMATMNTDQYQFRDGPRIETAEQDESAQPFETGQGDYTTERRLWLGKRTVRELIEEIERQRKTVAL
jgi:hypothetical protein